VTAFNKFCNNFGATKEEFHVICVCDNAHQPDWVVRLECAIDYTLHMSQNQTLIHPSIDINTGGEENRRHVERKKS